MSINVECEWKEVYWQKICDVVSHIVPVNIA